MVLPVASFAAGVAASRSGSSSVAFGVARIFPSKGPDVLIRVGSPHSASEGKAREGTSNYFVPFPL